MAARGVNRYALTQPPAVCALRELCDIGDIGKLTREQFALALHLINQKLTKGVEPPLSLSPEMIPPTDRQNMKQVRRDVSANLRGSSATRLESILLIISRFIHVTRAPRRFCVSVKLG